MLNLVLGAGLALIGYLVGLRTDLHKERRRLYLDFAGELSALSENSDAGSRQKLVDLQRRVLLFGSDRTVRTVELLFRKIRNHEEGKERQALNVLLSMRKDIQWTNLKADDVELWAPGRGGTTASA